MAKFLLFVTSSPDTQSAYSAIQFAQAVLQNKHQLEAVFFYGEGVLVANNLRVPPSDETHLTQLWQDIALNSKTRLIVCSAAAQRRGVLNNDEAKYHGLNHNNVAAPFEIAGLGEYVTLQANVDKVVQF